MKNRIAIAGIACLFLLCSCATIHEFPIEVFQPAKVQLDPGIKNVTLVSRNLKYPNDTLQNYFSRDYKLTKDLKRFNIDSITTSVCLDSLSAKMKEQARFSTVTMLPVSTLPKQYAAKITPPSKSFIQKVSSDTKADAVILLDMFSGFYTIYPVGEENRSVARVVTASMWTIFDPARYRILHHATMIDTLYWDGLDEQDNYKASSIPNKKAALEIAAGMAGVKYSKNLLPYWTRVQRSTLSSNLTDFQKANQLAKKNKWEEASAIWQQYTESNNKNHRLLSLYNLAVASEMDGDIDTAIQLITKASTVSSSPFNAMTNRTVRKYAAILAKRKVELEKINSSNYEE
ncbi:MAG TPA: DUF6340 family protein [Prolixibacteraceae bacterium]|nr:DUF6340 family protein [Prolixibacteraceae bacterium]